MKKEGVLFIILALIFIIPFATALNSTITSKAKDCILNKVSEEGCSTFGLEDQMFTLLSAKRCKTEFLDQAHNGECFGKTGCTVKETSQSILALSESSSDTDVFVNWVLNQNKTVPNLEWLLQVDTKEASTCTLTDEDSSTYTLLIAENKKLNLGGSQNCLTLDSTGYWLKIKPACYDQEFTISCDNAFLTSLLFKKLGSKTFYVSSDAQQKSAGGTTFEKINYGSLCLKKGANCDYEGTAWAAIVFKKIGEDYSPYLPYLITFKSDNEGYFPEAFLYYLTGKEEFKSELVGKQIGNRYWDALGNKYTDTALALLPFSSEDFEAKTNAVDWLTTIQGTDGCWDSGSIAETGFLLYSLTGSSATGGDGGDEDTYNCTSSGNYCIPDTDCSYSNLLGPSYDCPGFGDICCAQDTTSQECQANICDSYSNEKCPEGSEDFDAVLSEGQTCCLSECITTNNQQTEDTCTLGGGTCEDYGCSNNEEISNLYDCSDYSQSCCLPKESSGVAWWIWLLIVLIILSVIAIIFKDKLKAFYLKLKTKKTKPSTGRSGIPPARPPLRRTLSPRRALPPRTIIPKTSAPIRRSVQPKKKSNELDDVLKKLKEMGK